MKHTQPDIAKFTKSALPMEATILPLILDSTFQERFTLPISVFLPVRQPTPKRRPDDRRHAIKAASQQCAVHQSIISTQLTSMSAEPKTIYYPNNRWKPPTTTPKNQRRAWLHQQYSRTQHSIYNRKLSVQKLHTALKNYYHPYHTELDKIQTNVLSIMDFIGTWLPSCPHQPWTALCGLALTARLFLVTKMEQLVTSLLRRNVQSSLKDMGYQLPIVLLKALKSSNVSGDPAKVKLAPDRNQ